MSFAASTSRQLFRRSANARLTMPRVRFESTANTTAKAATDATAQRTSELQKKAADGIAKAQELSAKAQELSKQASAGLSKAAEAAQVVTKRLSEQGGQTGKIAGIIDKQLPLVTYYTRVVAETAKIIFQAQKMAPPPLSTFQAWGETIIASLKNPSGLSKQATELFQKLQGGLSTTQLAFGGVVLAECIGFFTVGEMIGRFKIIGYRGKVDHVGH